MLSTSRARKSPRLPARAGNGPRTRYQVQLDVDPRRRDSSSTYVMMDGVGYLLGANARLLRRSMVAGLAKHDIPHGHWAVLLALWAGDGVTQKVLSRRIAIEEPTLARAVTQMEGQGLVRRTRGEADGRQVLVHLTAAGAKFRDVLIPIALEEQRLAVSGLQPKERKTLIMLLRKMLETNRSRFYGTESS